MNKRGGDTGRTGPPTYPLLRVRGGRSQVVSPSTLPHLRAGRLRLIWGRFFPAVFGRFLISFWPFFPIILLNLINGGIRLLWPYYYGRCPHGPIIDHILKLRPKGLTKFQKLWPFLKGAIPIAAMKRRDKNAKKRRRATMCS